MKVFLKDNKLVDFLNNHKFVGEVKITKDSYLYLKSIDFNFAEFESKHPNSKIVIM